MIGFSIQRQAHTGRIADKKVDTHPRFEVQPVARIQIVLGGVVIVDDHLEPGVLKSADFEIELLSRRRGGSSGGSSALTERDTLPVMSRFYLPYIRKIAPGSRQP